jgi:hypothetical protein
MSLWYSLRKDAESTTDKYRQLQAARVGFNLTWRLYSLRLAAA